MCVCVCWGGGGGVGGGGGIERMLICILNKMNCTDAMCDSCVLLHMLVKCRLHGAFLYFVFFRCEFKKNVPFHTSISD